MRKVILDIAVTLDGLIEGANGELDWLIFDDEIVQFSNDFLKEVDTIFYGRKAYEVFGKQSSDSSSSKSEKEFTNTVNNMTKYVFSKTLKKVEGNVIVIDGNIAEEVKKIKQQPGKDIWLSGGSSIITTFADLDLIDKYRLSVHPIVLRSGRPLFKGINDKLNLKLLETKSFSSGVVLLSYQPVPRT